jgi:hypothetical protein
MSDIYDEDIIRNVLIYYKFKNISDSLLKDENKNLNCDDEIKGKSKSKWWSNKTITNETITKCRTICDDAEKLATAQTNEDIDKINKLYNDYKPYELLQISEKFLQKAKNLLTIYLSNPKHHGDGSLVVVNYEDYDEDYIKFTSQKNENKNMKNIVVNLNKLITYKQSKVDNYKKKCDSFTKDDKEFFVNTKTNIDDMMKIFEEKSVIGKSVIGNINTDVKNAIKFVVDYNTNTSSTALAPVVAPDAESVVAPDAESGDAPVVAPDAESGDAPVVATGDAPAPDATDVPTGDAPAPDAPDAESGDVDPVVAPDAESGDVDPVVATDVESGDATDAESGVPTDVATDVGDNTTGGGGRKKRNKKMTVKKQKKGKKSKKRTTVKRAKIVKRTKRKTNKKAKKRQEKSTTKKQ